MSYSMNRLGNRLAEHRIVGSRFTHLEELFAVLLAVFVPQAVEVHARHGIYHVLPEVSADFAVLV